ncbi:MAG: hypothetical protein IJR88_00760 [Clostridia bacterium]|nr:hypothetical protein [Clostridia bacterium]
MKKNYELVEVKVISLDNDDVITASASRNNSLLGQTFNFGEYNEQDFS